MKYQHGRSALTLGRKCGTARHSIAFLDTPNSIESHAPHHALAVALVASAERTDSFARRWQYIRMPEAFHKASIKSEKRRIFSRSMCR